MKNAMGEELNEGQRAIADCYERLSGALRTHGDELAPYENRNAVKALAALWQVMNGMDMDPGQVYDLGA